MGNKISLLVSIAAVLLFPALACAQEAGDQWTEPVTGMEFVWVPGGCYDMGCGEWAGEYCTASDPPVHEVCVDGFWLGKYEVTQGQWNGVMEGNPAHFQVSDEHPVEQVSWEDVQEFIAVLESLGGNAYEFRLPNEAEWEYACRSGGRDEIYSGGNDGSRVAWYNTSEFGDGTNQVGTKEPNALGLYDMSGNVSERVEFWLFDDPYISHGHESPMYTTYGIYRIIRGGGWEMRSRGVRCFSRGVLRVDHGSRDIGFRLLRDN